MSSFNQEKSPLSLLIVDDDPNILKALRRLILRAMPTVKVTIAENGKEALQALNYQNFTMIVSDLRMPELDGDSLLKEVRRYKPSTIRILLSGQAETEKLLQCLSHSHQYIEKPCENEDIINLVNLMEKISNCELPPILIKHALSFTSFLVDGGIYSLVSHLTEKNHDKINCEKLGKLLFCDLGIFLAASRIQCIAGDISIDLIKELISSPCLIPIQIGTENSRRLRVLSIRFAALAKKLIDVLGICAFDALKTSAYAYCGEYILELQLGSSPLNHQIIKRFSSDISEIICGVWGIKCEVSKDPKFLSMKNEIDQMYSFNGELGLVDDDAMTSLLGSIISTMNFSLEVQ